MRMDMSDNLPGADGSGRGSQRGNARDSLFLAGKLTFQGIAQVYDVRIRNLSATGMMAECPAAVGPGHVVVIETKGIGEIPGKIAWATEGRIGIAFDLEVDPTLARNPNKSPDNPGIVRPDYLSSFIKSNTSRRTGFNRP
jgi:hypothetical protein